MGAISKILFQACTNGVDGQPCEFELNQQQLRDDYERGIKISEGEGDDSTNDLLISYHTAIEKRIWMMSAELGQRPDEGE